MRVEDPGPVGDQGARITELWAWTAISPTYDTEGIVSARPPEGGGLPMVSSMRSIMEKFRPFAEEVGRQTGAVIRLRHFVAVDE